MKDFVIWEMQNLLIIFPYSILLNSCFSKTIGMISFIKFLISSFLLEDDQVYRKSFSKYTWFNLTSNVSIHSLLVESYLIITFLPDGNLIVRQVQTLLSTFTFVEIQSCSSSPSALLFSQTSVKIS